MARTRARRFPRVPYAGIRLVVDRLHVSTPDADVRADLETRASASGATPAELAEITRYALAVHRENRGIYLAVTSGRLGRGAP